MNKKIKRGSSNDEIVRNELTSPKHFEGGKTLPLPLTERVKRMEKIDPGGQKAYELAKKYRR